MKGALPTVLAIYEGDAVPAVEDERSFALLCLLEVRRSGAVFAIGEVSLGSAVLVVDDGSWDLLSCIRQGKLGPSVLAVYTELGPAELAVNDGSWGSADSR